MKKIMILASVALFSACSLEEVPVSPEANNELKTITVPISAGAADTRIAVDENESSTESWKFEWETDDDVSVWYSGCTAFAQFEMDEDGYDEDLSTFSGSVPENTTEIRVISPADNSTSISGSTYSLNIAAQDGDLGKLYMMSDELITVEGTEISGATPDMKHLGGFLAIYFELENKVTSYTYEITEVKLSGVPTTMDVYMTGSFDDDSYYGNMNADGTITATLSGKIFGEDDVEVRLNTLPFTFEKEKELTLDIKYKYNGAERTTQVVIENTTESAIPFERAKFNYCTITLDGSEGLTVSGATIKGWGEGNGEGEELDARPDDDSE